jgi:hypothetical protein
MGDSCYFLRALYLKQLYSILYIDPALTYCIECVAPSDVNVHKTNLFLRPIFNLFQYRNEAFGFILTSL